MNGWFDLTMPWWEFVLRGAVGYIGLLIVMRIAGKHAFGEMSPFDIVVLILVGGVLRPALLGDDKSVLGPFIVVTTILAVDSLLGLLAARSVLFNRWVEGRSVLLVRHGDLLHATMRRHGVAQAALERELRSKGLNSADDVEEARLEANGRISVLKRTSVADTHH